MKRRVVVTGIGIISPIGNGIQEFERGLKSGKDGKSEITSFDTTDYKLKKAAVLKKNKFYTYKCRDGHEEKEPANSLALHASNEAWRDSGVTDAFYNPNRRGVAIASSLASIRGKAKIHNEILNGKNVKDINFDAVYESASTPGGMVAKELLCLGPNISVSTACASGTNSLGCAFDMIKENCCDIVIAGGVDPFEEMSFSGFLSLQTITKDEMRPFDENRSGIDIGEGAGIVILEELENAKKRGAHIYAEICGYGLANDAYHATSPDPEGVAAIAAMRMAINESDLDENSIDYVNAHGTGTRINDKMELQAIRKVFGEQLIKDVKISSTKSMHGHMLGATGSVEAIACILAVRDGFVPGTMKTIKIMKEYEDLDIIVGETIKENINFALSNSFGFAGNASSIVIGRYIENVEQSVE